MEPRIPATTTANKVRPRGLWSLIAVVGLALAARHAQAAEYYLAPNGNDANPGTMAQPFATLQKGADSVAAGDTLWLRAGTYRYTKQIRITRSGTSSSRIKLWAYANEVPVIDFSGYVSTNTATDQPTILITGSWLHFKGLEVANGKVGASGSHSNDAIRSKDSSNNIFELLNIHHNFGPGLFIDGGTGGHLILNCDSHDNYDKDGSQGDGQNGDGFGVHYQMTGPSTILRGNRAWLNSDDGYDYISQEVPVTTESCWAVMNGYSDGGAGRPSSGNGNGFKAGSSQTGIRHILQNNVAWANRAAGFYANHSSGGNTWLNNTAYMNAVQYNMLASPAGDSSATITLTGALAHKMRNNIGFPNKNSNMGGVDTMFNTWDLGIAEAPADFASTSDAGYTGPRQADGSLPPLDFMKLKASSPLIDKGTNVGLPYTGAAPDLGAYEYGAVSTTGAGGSGASAGSGGTTGAGGRGGIGSGGGSGSGTTGGRGGTVGGSPGVGGRGGAAGGAVTTGGGGAPGSGGSDATTGSGGNTGAAGSAAGVTGVAGASATGSGGNVAGTVGTGGTTAGTPGAGSGGAAGSGSDGEPGCTCTTASARAADGVALSLVLASLLVLPARRRRRRG